MALFVQMQLKSINLVTILVMLIQRIAENSTFVSKESQDHMVVVLELSLMLIPYSVTNRTMFQAVRNIMATWIRN